MTCARNLWLYLVMVYLISFSEQHGRMIDPPGRSTMWRYGFTTPNNYNDNELYCGGRSAIQQTGGLCGVCGDPYHGKRENEAGGKYATGVIARDYPEGTPTITVRIELTAWHMGHYEFRICPHNNPNKPVTQECLNENPLPIAEASDDKPMHYKPEQGGIHELTLLLPPGLTCSQCVLQWRYRAGNSWGSDPDGKTCLGCGVQEEFRNCADIKIGNSASTSGVDHQPFIEEIEPGFNHKEDNDRRSVTAQQPKVSEISNNGPIIPSHHDNIAEQTTSREINDWQSGSPGSLNHISTTPRNFIHQQNFVQEPTVPKKINNQPSTPGTPRRIDNVAETSNLKHNNPREDFIWQPLTQEDLVRPTTPRNFIRQQNNFDVTDQRLNSLDSNSRRLEPQEVSNVLRDNPTRPDERLSSNGIVFRNPMIEQASTRQRSRDPLINLPVSSRQRLRQQLNRRNFFGPSNPSHQVNSNWHFHDWRDTQQNQNRRNTLRRDGQVSNHFSQFSRPRHLNELIRRRNRGMADSTNSLRQTDPSGRKHVNQFTINRNIAPKAKQIQETKTTVADQRVSPVPGGVFRKEEKIAKPEQTSSSRHSKKDTPTTEQSNREKLRKKLDRENLIRDLWRRIVLLNRMKLWRNSFFRNLGRINSRARKFPTASAFKTKTRTVSVSMTPPDENGDLFDNTNSLTKTKETATSEKSPKSSVKTYKNVYNKINPSSLEGSKSKPAWYENFINHAQKQKAKVMSDNRVQLADSTVIRIPKGAVIGQ